ncbi:MAG: hypothetical protein Q8Q73_01175 [Stagnimonas sp.]|nr:hypothetical protein [Stagnimonas sp.]
MSTKPTPPEAGDDARRPQEPANKEPGTNAVDHEPDPHAKPIPDGEHKYIPRSPYTSGNV